MGSELISFQIFFTLVHLIFMISNLFCKIEDLHCHKGRLLHISFFLPILFSFMVSLQHFFKHKAMAMILRYKIVLHTILFSGCYQCFFFRILCDEIKYKKNHFSFLWRLKISGLLKRIGTRKCLITQLNQQLLHGQIRATIFISIEFGS